MSDDHVDVTLTLNCLPQDFFYGTEASCQSFSLFSHQYSQLDGLQNVSLLTFSVKLPLFLQEVQSALLSLTLQNRCSKASMSHNSRGAIYAVGQGTSLTWTAVWAGSTGPGVLTLAAFTESPAYLSIFLGLRPQGNKYQVILDSSIDQTMANTICGFIISSGPNLDEISQTCQAWQVNKYQESLIILLSTAKRKERKSYYIEWNRERDVDHKIGRDIGNT